MNQTVLKAIKNPFLSELIVPIEEAVSADDIQQLAKHCPYLTSLTLSTFDEKTLQCLPLLSNIVKIFLKDTDDVPISGKWLEAICSISQLTHITLHGCECVDLKFFKNLCRLQQLVSINLELCEPILDDELKIFSKFSHLRFLNLDGSRFLSDKGLLYVASLINLEGLELAFATNITDKGFQLLSSLKKLKYLDLGGTQVSDECLRSFSSLHNLELLNLNYCEHITAQGLLSLKNLPSLRLVCIGKFSQITEPIKEILPSVQIFCASDSELTFLGLENKKLSILKRY